MLYLADYSFKIAIINIVKYIKENVIMTSKQLESLSKKLKWWKNQLEIPELRSKVFE